MHMQASLLASAALTAEVAALKQDLEGSKKGWTLLLDCSTTVAEDEDEWLLRAKPLAKS